MLMFMLVLGVFCDPHCWCRREETLKQTMTLSGPKAYTTEEVIALCEEYGNAEADVSFQNT